MIILLNAPFSEVWAGIIGFSRRYDTSLSTCGSDLCKTSHSIVTWKAKIAVSQIIFLKPLTQSLSEFISCLQNLARFCTVHGADESTSFHQVQDLGGSPVPNRQPSL